MTQHLPLGFAKLEKVLVNQRGSRGAIDQLDNILTISLTQGLRRVIASIAQHESIWGGRLCVASQKVSLGACR